MRPSAPSYRAGGRGRALASLLAAITLLASLLVVSAYGDTELRPSAATLTLTLPPSSIPSPSLEAEGPAARELVVQAGDSLSRLFDREGLDRGDLHHIMLLPESQEGLRLLRPGDRITLTGSGSRVETLSRRLDESRVLEVWRRGEAWDARIVEEQIERRVAYAHGVLEDTLYDAAQAAGLSDGMTMRVAELFGWDVDFALDIRSGDEFTVIYEQLYRDGDYLRDGEIIAATFTNRGTTYDALRYTDPLGRTDYFDSGGDSVRKAFLRAPVDFRYISSGFNPSRLHPILGTRRPHRGVDYSAEAGSPIVAAGDGRIIFRGVKSGYGNCVIVQHGETRTTLYAHMSSFRRGQRTGQRVTQGTVIGYVGMTGLATAPHLHYEFRVDGVHRNPRTVPLPDATPVNPLYVEHFEEAATPLVRQLDLVRRASLAASTS